MRNIIWGAAAVAVLLLAAPVPGLAQDKPAPAKVVSSVNLNTATVAELEVLPGIGRGTAQRIVEYRQKTGGFKKIEELMNVRGIGEKSFLKLKPMITVTPKPDKPTGPQ
jgi:competence protein ComEA